VNALNTIQSELERLGFKSDKKVKPVKRKKKKSKQKYSTREIEALMGKNKQTYRRGKGGALRSR
jgi:hypothetical protein